MKPEVTDKLAEARDFCSLTRTVLSLCEPYGPVHAFRFVHNRGAGRVACFIELESPKQEMALARALGARMNGSVCLDIPVRKDFGEAADADGGARFMPPPQAAASSLQVAR